MYRPICGLLLAVLLMAWSDSPAQAVSPIVQDKARFFGAETLKKVNEQLREIYVKYDRDLFVETLETVPTDHVEKVKAMSRDERYKYFETLARARMQQRAVNGIYVVICKEPSIIWVEISPRAGSVFDAAVRTRLRDKLIEDFKDKRYDDGLTNAVKIVRDKLGTK